MLVSLKNILFPPRPPFNHPYSALDPETASHSSFALQDTLDCSSRDDRRGTKSESIHLDGPRPCHSSSLLSCLSDPRVVSDATIGLSDGLTVPFALTAGLSALGSSRIVIFGGLAELIAGAISMGLGGWLAASGEAAAYKSTLRSTQRLVQQSPSTAMKLAHSTLQPYLSDSSSPPDIVFDVTRLTRFLMRFHHNLPEPSNTRSAWLSAATIGGGYFLGGFVPLLPYFFVGEVGRAFWWSLWIMVVALFVFGCGKAWITLRSTEDLSRNLDCELAISQGRGSMVPLCVKGGVQMVVLGGIAAAAAMGLVKAFDTAGAG